MKKTQFSDYVGDLFINHPFIGEFKEWWTDVAMAIKHTRIEDIPRTRNGRKYVMLFTDGKSIGDVPGEDRFLIFNIKCLYQV